MSIERRFALIGHTHPPGAAQIEFATRQETEAGQLIDKAVHPDGGAYAYDRLRKPGQHEAGKGTKVVASEAVEGVHTFDLLTSNVFDIALASDVSIENPVNPIDGQVFNFFVRQDEVGGRTITSWGNQWTFVNKITPVLTTDPNATDLLSCQYDPVEGKMLCSFLPNFGSGFTAPGSGADLTFTNVGAGNQVFKEVVGADVRFRTIIGTGDIEVTTDGDTVVVNYTAPTPGTTVEQLDDLVDVDAPAPQDGDGLEWSDAASAWIPVPKARKWTVGATWSNGANVLGTSVNKVNAIIAEDCVIEEWYIVTDGGSGSCVVDVRRVPLTSYPPLSTDTICGGEKPSLSSQTAANDPSLGAWDVDCTAGDVLQFVLESVSTFKMVQIVLVVRKVS